MEENLIKSNLNSVKEMVLDEGKLVTYISLSKDMCLHVNHCKILLNKFIEQIRKENPEVELNVSYIISGQLGDDSSRTMVVSEKEIETVRKDFQNLFYEHVYSVAVGPNTIDNVAFLAVNKLEDFPLCTGQIKNPDCVKRTSEEISNLKSKSQALINQELKQSTTKVGKKEIKDDIKTVTKVHEVKSEPSIKSEVTSLDKESIHINAKQIQENKKNGHKAQKGIAGFFTKSASAPTKKGMKDFEHKENKLNYKESTKNKVKKEIHNPVENNVNGHENSPQLKSEVKEEKMDVDEEEVNVKSKATVKPGKSKPRKEPKNKSVSLIKRNTKVDKNRKRVLHVSDSESDNEKDPFANEPELKVDHESEDEIPPTPSVNAVKISSSLVNPKKKRKVVDKTYTGEDGYILTKKEVVYESCSDNEEENHTNENTNDISNLKIEAVSKQETSPKEKEKKNGVKNSKKKISPPQKGKQATLMNFFKKV